MSFQSTDFHPGDRVRFRLPRDVAGFCQEVGGLVLHNPGNSLRGLLRVVITDPVVVTADPRYAANAECRVPLTDVVERHGPVPDGTPPLLDILIVEGEVVGMRRADGRTAAVRVTVTRDGRPESLLIDHRGMRALDPDGE